MVKQKVDYYHFWNTINLSLFSIGWIVLYDSFKNSNLVQAYIAVFLIMIILASIYYQNKLERNLE